MVKIISGDHKGQTGEIMKVLTDKKRVLIKGKNLSYKHVRPSQKNPQGGRIQVEKPIHISNVLPLDKSGNASRVKFEVDKKGVKQRVTIDGNKINDMSKVKKK